MPSPPALSRLENTGVVSRRFAAFLFDVVVVAALASLIVLPFHLTATELEIAGPSGVHSSVSIAVVSALAWLYFTVPEGLFGCTVGKLALGLHVVCLTSGTKPTLRQAALRNLGLFVDAPLLGVPALVAIATSPLQQRLGDRWADTVVIARGR